MRAHVASRWSRALLVAWLAAGCSGSSGSLDGAVDAGAGGDAGGPDAGLDAGGRDAGGRDAGLDAAAGADATAGPDAALVSPFACPGGATGPVFVGETSPPASVAPWQAFSASVTFANCSTETWTAPSASAPTGYKLGFDAPRDYDTWGASRVALPAEVPPGSQVTITVPARAGALTGPHGWSWAVVNEGVAWLTPSSPLHTVTIAAAPSLATICPGVQADIGGGASASGQVQQCIDATTAGGTLELPAGIYRITSELQIAKPLTLRTAGTAAEPLGCLAPGGPRCAVFRADDNLLVPRGFLRLGATTGVVLEHLVLDGNREQRLASTAAGQCAAGTNGSGFNAANAGCAGCSFVKSGSARALCGTGFEWRADQATVTGSEFRENGAHAVNNMWSDGLTLLQSSGAQVTGNRFVDNSDVDLIFGGGPGATVQGNRVTHVAQASFAGLMLDNFNGGTSGDFTGTSVSGNSIDCGAQLCDYAIELGPHAWYLSANLIGGAVTGNTANGGKFGINAEGAGTAASPMVVSQNTVGPSPASASFQCGTRPCTAFNISPDSHVDVQSGPAATGALTHHVCP